MIPRMIALVLAPLLLVPFAAPAQERAEPAPLDEGASAPAPTPGDDPDLLPPPPPPPVMEAPSAPSEAPAATAAPEAIGQASDPGEQALKARFEQGFELVVAEDWSAAIPVLREVLDRSRNPETHGAAGALLRLAEYRLPGRSQAGILGTPADSDGRFGFVALSTIAGLAAGLELSLALDLGNDPTGPTLLTMATTGGAFLASLMATKDARITEGEALLYGYGLLTGTYDALLLSLLLEAEGQAIPALMFGGMVVGGAVAMATARGTKISSGDASLIGSGALWGSILSGFALAIIQPSGRHAVEPILLLGTNVGVAAAAIAANSVELSRDRVLLMDTGALLGAVGLGGTGLILFWSNRDGLRIWSAMTSVGILAGAGLALYLTRDMDASGGEKATSLGALLQVDDGRVAWGVPVPVVAPSPQPGGETMVWAPLAVGRF